MAMSDNGGESRGEFTFVCPECEESIAVDDPMKDALVENGCVVCGSPVTPAAFTSGSTGNGRRGGS